MADRYREAREREREREGEREREMGGGRGGERKRRDGSEASKKGGREQGRAELRPGASTRPMTHMTHARYAPSPPTCTRTHCAQAAWRLAGPSAAGQPDAGHERL